MRFCAVGACVALLFTPGGPAAAHPNDSIARERIQPTPYGQRLARTSLATAPLPDSFNELIEGSVQDAPDSRAQCLDAVEKAQQHRGAYSAELVEPLVSAGRAFQQVQDHGEAMDYFRRALHLSRVNEGLFSANQLPILENMVRSQLALGNLAAADYIQQYRFRVEQHVYAEDFPAMMAATKDYIEWQQQLYLSGFGDETYLRLLKIHQLQSQLIEQLEADESARPELISQLYQRLDSEYLLADYDGEKQPLVQIGVSSVAKAGPYVSTDLEQQEFRMIKNNCFRSGLKTLERLVELMEAREPPQIEEIARAKIALGDWYLWWDWDARALQNYREAYSLYAHDGDPATDPAQLFSEPVELPEDPVFRPILNTPSDRSKARALVSLSISELGQARDIEILELDAEDAMGARITLFKMLKEVRFRPLVVDGQVVATNSVVREYRFDH